MTVGMVVDHSRSMGPKLQGVSAAVSAFAQSSNPDDEMFVVDFSDNVSVELPGGKPFTSNPRELAQAVSAVSARGMTALYDAVAEGLNHLQLGRWDKKALIIVSDGGDNASGRKYADVLELARRSQAVIYAIGLVGAPEEENPGVLRRLCKDTGGLAFFPAEGQSVSDISTIIAHDLREQYTLGFTPEKKKRRLVPQNSCGSDGSRTGQAAGADARRLFCRGAEAATWPEPARASHESDHRHEPGRGSTEAAGASRGLLRVSGGRDHGTQLCGLRRDGPLLVSGR